MDEIIGRRRNRYHLTPARSAADIYQLCPWDLLCLFEIFFGPCNEGGAAKFFLPILTGRSNRTVWVLSIAAKVNLASLSSSFHESKIFCKYFPFLEIRVFLVNMGDPHQLDFLGRVGDIEKVRRSHVYAILTE